MGGGGGTAKQNEKNAQLWRFERENPEKKRRIKVTKAIEEGVGARIITVDTKPARKAGVSEVGTARAGGWIARKLPLLSNTYKPLVQKKRAGRPVRVCRDVRNDVIAKSQ